MNVYKNSARHTEEERYHPLTMDMISSDIPTIVIDDIIGNTTANVKASASSEQTLSKIRRTLENPLRGELTPYNEDLYNIRESHNILDSIDESNRLFGKKQNIQIDVNPRNNPSSTNNTKLDLNVLLKRAHDELQKRGNEPDPRSGNPSLKVTKETANEELTKKVQIFDDEEELEYQEVRKSYPKRNSNQPAYMTKEFQEDHKKFKSLALPKRTQEEVHLVVLDEKPIQPAMTPNRPSAIKNELSAPIDWTLNVYSNEKNDQLDLNIFNQIVEESDKDTAKKTTNESLTKFQDNLNNIKNTSLDSGQNIEIKKKKLSNTRLKSPNNDKVLPKQENTIETNGMFISFKLDTLSDDRGKLKYERESRTSRENPIVPSFNKTIHDQINENLEEMVRNMRDTKSGEFMRPPVNPLNQTNEFSEQHNDTNPNNSNNMIYQMKNEITDQDLPCSQNVTSNLNDTANFNRREFLQEGIVGQSLYRFYFCLHSADLYQCLSEHIIKENVKIMEQENSIKALKQIFHNKLEQATIFKNEILNIYKNQPAFNGSFAGHLKEHYESLKKEVADLKKIYEFNVSMNSSKLIYLGKAQTILANMQKLNESDVSQNVIMDIVKVLEALDSLQISLDMSTNINEKIITSCLTTYGANSEVKELVNDTAADKFKLANFRKADAPVYEIQKHKSVGPPPQIQSIGQNHQMARTLDFMKLNSFKAIETGNEPEPQDQFKFFSNPTPIEHFKFSSNPVPPEIVRHPSHNLPNSEKHIFDKFNFKKQQPELEPMDKPIPKKSYADNEKLKGMDVEKMVNDISKKYNLKFQKNEMFTRKRVGQAMEEVGMMREDQDGFNIDRIKSRTDAMKSYNPNETKGTKQVLAGEMLKLQKLVEELKFKNN